MYHHEGLRLSVEIALRDGFWPAGDDVARVVVRDLCSSQGELRHDVGVVSDPLSRCGQGGAGQSGVRCWKSEDAKSGILAGKYLGIFLVVICSKKMY